MIDAGASEHNFGGGYRHLFGDDFLIAGGNFYWDSRHSVHNNRLNQLGFGAEALTKWVDFRSNFYLALTDEQLISSSSSFRFASTSINRITSKTFEEPLSGFDYEGGVLVPIVSRWLETRAYAGGFYYDSDLGDNLYGFRSRIDIYPTPLFTIQLQLENDNQSDTDFFIGGYISIPFELGNLVRGKNPFEGLKERFRLGKGARTMRERMTEPVFRDTNVVTEDVVQTEEDVVVSNVIYVDNRNDTDGAENGTLEHPHNTLLEGFANPRYRPGATIYVRAGDGTSVGYEDAYTLTSNTVLWGQGFQRFPGIGGGPAPKIDCMGADPCVTMAMNTQLMGFTIDPGVNGVAATNVSGVSIHHNTITDHTSNGIVISNTDGGTHSGFNLFANVITDNGSNGILIENTGGSTTTNVKIRNNTISDNGSRGIFVDNESSSTATGFTIKNNRVMDNGDDGIEVSISGSDADTFVFINNTATGNSGHGIHIDADDSSTVRDFTFRRNTLTDNDSDGMRINVQDDSTGENFTFTRNTFNDNDNHGMSIRVADDSEIMDFTFTRNTFNDNSADGLNLISNDTSDDDEGMSNFIFRRNTFNGNSESGIDMTADDGHFFDFNFTRNTFNDNDSDGMTVTAIDDSEIFNFHFTRNTFRDNNDDGVDFTEDSGDIFDMFFGDAAARTDGFNSFTGNGGVDIDNDTGETIKAENNFWGGGGANTSGDTVDDDPFLTSDPN